MLALPTEFYDLDQEVQELNDTLVKERERLRIVTSLIESFNVEMVKTFPDSFTDITFKQKEIEVLSKYLREAEFETFNKSYAKAENFSKKPEPIKANAKHMKLCKKLYGKISIRCHPDKTDDEFLHSVFLAAKEAMKIYDLNTLDKLWKVVKSKKRKKLLENMPTIQSRLAQLRNQRNLLKGDLIQLQNSIQGTIASVGYQCARLYIPGSQESKDKIATAYKQIIDGEIKDLDLKIQELRTKLSYFDGKYSASV